MGEKKPAVPPRLFVKGRYVGGADELLKIHEEGHLVDLLHGLPKVKIGAVCDGCGDVRFFPCFQVIGAVNWLWRSKMSWVRNRGILLLSDMLIVMRMGWCSAPFVAEIFDTSGVLNTPITRDIVYLKVFHFNPL